MKFKYIGDQDEITLRRVTFKAGKAVDLSENPLLAAKIAKMPDFEEVKSGRKAKKNDQDE